jgi:hypothetical protein
MDSVKNDVGMLMHNEIEHNITKFVTSLVFDNIETHVESSVDDNVWEPVWDSMFSNVVCKIFTDSQLEAAFAALERI